MANTCRMSLIRLLYWWQCSHLTAPTIPNRNSCALDALPRQGAARPRPSTKSNYRRGGKKEGVVRKKVVSSPDCRRPPGWRCCNAWCYSTEILRSALAGVEADARTTADQDFPDTTGHSSSEPIFAQTSRQVSPQLC